MLFKKGQYVRIYKEYGYIESVPSKKYPLWYTVNIKGRSRRIQGADICVDEEKIGYSKEVIKNFKVDTF